jgi:hypothetical protein
MNRKRPAHPRLTPQEIKRRATAFERYFGAIRSGDPNFSDNERIDADLAEQYGRQDQRSG